jgi:hypothetical protein
MPDPANITINNNLPGEPDVQEVTVRLPLTDEHLFLRAEARSLPED